MWFANCTKSLESQKHGEKASDWQLKKLKSSMSKIFHEGPGKHADYKTVTNATAHEKINHD